MSIVIFMKRKRVLFLLKVTVDILCVKLVTELVERELVHFGILKMEAPFWKMTAPCPDVNNEYLFRLLRIPDVCKMRNILLV